mgnify:CR=1 FL=1
MTYQALAGRVAILVDRTISSRAAGFDVMPLPNN